MEVIQNEPWRVSSLIRRYEKDDTPVWPEKVRTGVREVPRPSQVLVCGSGRR